MNGTPQPKTTRSMFVGAALAMAAAQSVFQPQPHYYRPDPPKAKPSRHKRAKVKAQRKQAQITRRNCR